VTVVTRKTDYACRVVLQLAKMPAGSWTTSRVVAASQDIPVRLIGSIISRLAKAGLVITKRGKGGGISLALPTCEISLLDVLRAMQGSVALNTCSISMGPCRLSELCPMRVPWERCQEALMEELRTATFDELAKGATATNQCTERI